MSKVLPGLDPNSTDNAIIRYALESLVANVQGGEYGAPDFDDMQVCGRIHCILERPIELK